MATDVDTRTDLGTEVSAKAEHEQLFRFSTWLHVGTGAENCDDREGDCGDPHHFHAWCRLPNKLQHREIREHALAAKARRLRQLRDPDSDAYQILELDIDRLSRLGDDAREDLVEELVSKEWWKDYLEAMADVKTLVEDDVDEDEGEQLVWEHIDTDRARRNELEIEAAQDPEIRDGDEYRELDKRLDAFDEAIKAREVELRAPRRKKFEEMDISALLDAVRDQRIDAHAQEEFLHVYAIWSWTTCTRRSVNGERLWEHPRDLTDLSEEVLEGLKVAYTDLERTAKEVASQGNS